jgi:hypothetical protein
MNPDLYRNVVCFTVEEKEVFKYLMSIVEKQVTTKIFQLKDSPCVGDNALSCKIVDLLNKIYNDQKLTSFKSKCDF